MGRVGKVVEAFFVDDGYFRAPFLGKDEGVVVEAFAFGSGHRNVERGVSAKGKGKVYGSGIRYPKALLEACSIDCV